MSKLETTILESGRESCQERLPQVRYPRAAVLWYSSSSVLRGATEDSGKYWGGTAFRSIHEGEFIHYLVTPLFIVATDNIIIWQS